MAIKKVRPRRAWTPPKPKPPPYRGPKLLPAPPRGKRGRATAAAAPSFNPLTGWTTDPVHGVWASDPLWVPPADGGAVASWRNGGSTYTTGAYIGADGLVLPGTTTTVRMDCATIPDVAAMRPTGDMELVVYVTATDWTPVAADVLALNGLNGNIATTNWYLYLNTDGTLAFSRPSGATARVYTSSAATGVTNGTAKYIRVLFDQDNGASASSVTFWLSDDGSTWAQLGTAVTNANVGAGNSDTTGTTIGNVANNVAFALAGTIHRVQVWSGLVRAAAAVLDADFSAATEGISAFTESSSNAAVVTVVSSQNPVQATGSKQPTYDAALAAFNNAAVVTFATDDVLAFDPANLAQPYYLVVIGATAGGSGVERLVGIGTNTGYGLGDDGTPDWTFSAGTAIAGGTPDANPHLFRATANGASSALLVDETSIVASNAGATGLTVLALGAGVSTLGTYANYLSGSIAYAAIFNTDPTALPEWSTFTSWVETTYGLVIA